MSFFGAFAVSFVFLTAVAFPALAVMFSMPFGLLTSLLVAIWWNEMTKFTIKVRIFAKHKKLLIVICVVLCGGNCFLSFLTGLYYDAETLTGMLVGFALTSSLAVGVYFIRNGYRFLSHLKQSTVQQKSSQMDRLVKKTAHW